MDKIRLGRTGIMVGRSGFGALPIQRISFEAAGMLLKRAYEAGINFFDTARAYSDSEEKIGYALADVRKDIIIATKTFAADKRTLLEQLKTSLKNLKTDYIDIYQFHNPKLMPAPGDFAGIYDELLRLRKEGVIRFIGITSHRLNVAMEAASSGLYDTIQFPLNTLSSEDDLKLITECRKYDVGVIAMKALSGGLISNVPSTFAFLRQFDNVVPIWGIQRESELDEFLKLEKEPPVLDQSMLEAIEKDRAALAGSFCRGCGYCMPCPAGIPIDMAARMSLLLTRAPYKQFMSDEWRDRMELIDKCTGCGQCAKRCPYSLNTPELLKTMLRGYREFYRSHAGNQ